MNEKIIPGVDVTLKDECLRGGKVQVLEQLRRKISSITRSDSNVEKIYIGIASGADYVHALWRRYDVYKQEQRINEMIAVYHSSSQKSCRGVEDDLVQFYSGHLVNRTGGGGGRNSEQPNHYVYLAIKRVNKRR